MSQAVIDLDSRWCGVTVLGINSNSAFSYVVSIQRQPPGFQTSRYHFPIVFSLDRMHPASKNQHGRNSYISSLDARQPTSPRSFPNTLSTNVLSESDTGIIQLSSRSHSPTEMSNGSFPFLPQSTSDIYQQFLAATSTSVLSNYFGLLVLLSIASITLLAYYTSPPRIHIVQVQPIKTPRISSLPMKRRTVDRQQSRFSYSNGAITKRPYIPVSYRYGRNGGLSTTVYMVPLVNRWVETSVQTEFDGGNDVKFSSGYLSATSPPLVSSLRSAGSSTESREPTMDLAHSMLISTTKVDSSTQTIDHPIQEDRECSVVSTPHSFVAREFVSPLNRDEQDITLCATPTKIPTQDFGKTYSKIQNTEKIPSLVQRLDTYSTSVLPILVPTALKSNVLKDTSNLPTDVEPSSSIKNEPGLENATLDTVANTTSQDLPPKDSFSSAIQGITHSSSSPMLSQAPLWERLLQQQQQESPVSLSSSSSRSGSLLIKRDTYAFRTMQRIQNQRKREAERKKDKEMKIMVLKVESDTKVQTEVDEDGDMVMELTTTSSNDILNSEFKENLEARQENQGSIDKSPKAAKKIFTESVGCIIKTEPIFTGPFPFMKFAQPFCPSRFGNAPTVVDPAPSQAGPSTSTVATAVISDAPVQTPDSEPAATITDTTMNSTATTAYTSATTRILGFLGGDVDPLFGPKSRGSRAGKRIQRCKAAAQRRLEALEVERFKLETERLAKEKETEHALTQLG
ncbi:hypothetical protein ABKN59_002227 [Abortiporus biennis]